MIDLLQVRVCVRFSVVCLQWELIVGEHFAVQCVHGSCSPVPLDEQAGALTDFNSHQNGVLLSLSLKHALLCIS